MAEIDDTKTIQIKVHGQPVTVTVARANTRRGIQRWRLMDDKVDATDPDMQYICMFVYPCLVAGTIEVQGMDWPMTAEQVADELNEDTTQAWLSAIYEVNPNWEPHVPAGDAEKKE